MVVYLVWQLIFNFVVFIVICMLPFVWYCLFRCCCVERGLVYLFGYGMYDYDINCLTMLLDLPIRALMLLLNGLYRFGWWVLFSFSFEILVADCGCCWCGGGLFCILFEFVVLFGLCFLVIDVIDWLCWYLRWHGVLMFCFLVLIWLW